MKLLHKTTLYYLLFALPVFAICSASIYFFISREIKHELDENLWKNKISLERKIREGIDPLLLTSNNTEIRESSEAIDTVSEYSDADLFNGEDQEVLPYRILKSGMTSKNKYYELTLRESYVESDDLISSILIPIISLFVILLLGFLLINYLISKKLWAPFYETIGKLRNFDSGKNELSFQPQRIKEFDELNRSLQQMTQRAYQDYKKQKEFTENASHEIQTPLAIILNKTELLIQSSRLGEEEMKLISGIYESAGRLSHLNKTLLLLTRIDNLQFRDQQDVNVKKIVLHSLEMYKQQADEKEILISASLKDSYLTIDPVLCEMLINNVLMNSIRHNFQKGSIAIELDEKILKISNTGKALNTSPDQLFERFRKDTSSPESTGLGLAIIKSICATSNISVSYTIERDMHLITLKW